MAKIRSYNKFSCINQNGEVSTDAINIEGFEGFRISIDIDGTAKRVRRICECGNMDDGSTDGCEQCHNTTFYPITLRKSRWHSYDCRVYDSNPRVRNDMLVARFADFQWDETRECFIIQEMFMDTIVKVDGCYNLNYYNIDSKSFDKAFVDYVQNRPEWANAMSLWERYPATSEEASGGYRACANNAERITGYYNILATIPDIDKVPENEFRAIYTRFVSTSHKKYTSIMDFYKQNKIPCSLSSIYCIVGVPSSDLSKIDSLDPAIIKAISYALVHNQVTYHELDCMLRWTDVTPFNEKAVEFAEFFRKNIVKYSSNVWEAFQYVDCTPGAVNMKDANIRKFVNYAVKKGIKRDKAYNFADLLDRGQGVEALKALIS